VATSQNGWPASSDKRAIGVDGAWSIRGAQFPGGVVAGPVATVLGYVADQFHQRVEPLVAGWCWGWAWRDIRGSTGLSNHASGTAIDVNAPRHPLGATGTFTTSQRDSIHAILAEAGGVVRWGGDYTGRKDEMHFEINAGYAAVAALAARLKEDDMPSPNDIWSAELWHHYPNTPEGRALAELFGNKPGDLVEEHKAGEWITAMAVRTSQLHVELAEVNSALAKILTKLEAAS